MMDIDDIKIIIDQIFNDKLTSYDNSSHHVNINSQTFSVDILKETFEQYFSKIFDTNLSSKLAEIFSNEQETKEFIEKCIKFAPEYFL